MQRSRVSMVRDPLGLTLLGRRGGLTMHQKTGCTRARPARAWRMIPRLLWVAWLRREP
jgi:hypothetical protein